MATRNIGIGLGNELGLTEAERATLVGEAAGLGYASAWTNARGLEALDTCLRWSEATGIASGVSVVPTPLVDIAALAAKARELSARARGRFILGIGAGALDDREWRAAHGLERARPISTMRAHLTALRQVAGPPVYLAALGPEMLRLAGAIADGVLPNWMDPRQIAWARERVAEGARAAGREESIPFAQYIRVSVDDDVALARRALAKAALSYALERPGQRRGGHYRLHFERMGFGPDLAWLEALRDRGATDDQVADACPEELLCACGGWGRADDAIARARRLAEGLDLPIVRVVLARPGANAARAVLAACAPARWS